MEEKALEGQTTKKARFDELARCPVYRNAGV
jgi:hypothetical protein